jgi:ubiquinone/menaquinone biosynthesis C-methylase UbiE
MESDEEVLRLDLKTDEKAVQKQAVWAGIKPGMRVADLGCGPGKTTLCLQKLVQPDGEVVGVDYSEKRLVYAMKHYSGPGIEFICRNISMPLDDLEKFDLILIRFILEYNRSKAFDIVKNISGILKPGGILCLIDLDCNCLRHFGHSKRLESERTICEIMSILEKDADFDPYAGIKLYSYLYDLGYQDIDVNISPHHLIFGRLKEKDAYNWTMKVKVVARNSGYGFEEYKGDYKEFFKEVESFLADPRRFIYTPLISCRGRKPLALNGPEQPF